MSETWSLYSNYFLRQRSIFYVMIQIVNDLDFGDPVVSYNYSTLPL